jgi:putative ABC transport system permease protein
MARSNSIWLPGVLVVRCLVQRSRQTMAIVAALTLGVAMMVAMAAVYFDIGAKMHQEARTFGANLFVGQGSALMTQADFQQLQALIPEQAVVGLSPYLYGMLDSDQGTVAVMGVDWNQQAKLTPYWQVEGEWIRIGFDDRHAMIGKRLAEKKHLKVGDTLLIASDYGEQAVSIKAIFESGEAVDHQLVIQFALAQKLLNLTSKMHYSLWSVQQDSVALPELVAKLNHALPHLDTHQLLKISQAEGQLLGKLEGLMGLIVVFVFALSTLCVNTNLTAMITERRQEFALQKALGASNRSVLLQIFTETALMTVMAAILGLALGYLMAQVIGQSVFSAHIDVRWQVLPITGMVAFVAAWFAVYWPAQRAMRVEPALVLKGVS